MWELRLLLSIYYWWRYSVRLFCSNTFSCICVQYKTIAYLLLFLLLYYVYCRKRRAISYNSNDNSNNKTWYYRHSGDLQDDQVNNSVISVTRYLCSSFIACRSQWLRGLRRRSSAASLLRLRVRISSGTWVFLLWVLCVLSEVSGTSWSLVQRGPTDCGASLCVI
jgi:hypothetical protein